MENVMQTGLKRENYYEGTIMDIREIFIGFGRWLGSKGITDQGSICDYEDYLCEWDKQKEQQREDEHLEFICWINYKKEYEFPFMLIKGIEWDRFYSSDIEDDIMDMQIVEYDELYAKFKEITGVDLMKLDNFVSISYIDEGQNDIELIVNINGNNERFIIGV